MFAPDLAGQNSGLRGLGNKLSSPLKGFSVQKKAETLKRQAQKAVARPQKAQDGYFGEEDDIFDRRKAEKEDPFSTIDEKKMVKKEDLELSSSSASSSGDSDSSGSDGGNGNAKGDKAMKVVASCSLRVPAVGEAVRHVDWIEREDGDWHLNKEEVAVVAEVDAEGDVRLRNEHGQVSPHFLLRRYYCFAEVEELLPCQSRKPEVGLCVRSDGHQEVKCDGWTLAVGETAEVAQVGSYLDFKLRNPQGATTPKFLSVTGFSYVQVVRSCMVRWPAIGNKVRRDGGRPVKSGEWTLAAGEVAVVAQVDSKGAFRLRSGGSSSSISPVFFPRRRYCYVEDGARSAEAAGAPKETSLDFQPRQPDKAADKRRESADKGRSKTKVRKADKRAAEPGGGAAPAVGGAPPAGASASSSKKPGRAPGGSDGAPALPVPAPAAAKPAASPRVPAALPRAPAPAAAAPAADRGAPAGAPAGGAAAASPWADSDDEDPQQPAAARSAPGPKPAAAKGAWDDSDSDEGPAAAAPAAARTASGGLPPQQPAAAAQADSAKPATKARRKKVPSSKVSGGSKVSSGSKASGSTAQASQPSKLAESGKPRAKKAAAEPSGGRRPAVEGDSSDSDVKF